MLRLVIRDYEGVETVVPLVRDQVTIGRKEGSTIRLTERNVSRRHAELRRANGAYRIKDLGSYVGVVVNGQPLSDEAEVQPGDTILIGDYAINVEQEGQPRVGFEDEATQVAKHPLPARLVVLGTLEVGDERALPTEGSVVIGRDTDSGICLDDRSVSREHARITFEDGAYRVEDLGSANGTRINGKPAGEAPLVSGDVLEIGQVPLRFAEDGEEYVPSPSDIARYGRDKRMRTRLIAGGVTIVALLVAIALVSTGDDEPAETEVTVIEPAAAPAPAPKPANDGYDRALADCRSAVSAGRFAEAIAHANTALKARPEETEAEQCRANATRLYEMKQVFVRGKEALDRGDLEAAYVEFALLDGAEDFGSRPEVLATIQRLGEARLEEARRLAKIDRASTVRLTKSILAIPSMPEALRTEASALLAEVRAASPPRPQRAQPAGLPRQTAPRATSKGDALEVATACLSRGDNPCVVRALKGKARTANELGLLIETYRAMGKEAEARKQMAVYLRRYPNARRAQTYEQILARP